jgi:hypothetical protein
LDIDLNIEYESSGSDCESDVDVEHAQSNRWKTAITEKTHCREPRRFGERKRWPSRH